MTVGTRGENLIFLISQPRAGSTLLQRMLWCHPEIHTFSESWLMLHPLYALRPSGYQAEYGANYSHTALQEFLRELPEGDETYVEGVRRMYAHLYGHALKGSGKRYYLDKTPPYYHIIPDLYRVFPAARYIILLRNPLAVLGSILNKWIKGQWYWLYIYHHDLLNAPHLLRQGAALLGPSGLTVHYEQLVADPTAEAQRICAWLNLDVVPGMVDYGSRELPRWSLGDEQEVYQHGRPMEENVTKWARGLEHPQAWRFTSDYLHALGRDTVEQIGYSYDQLQHVLETRRPKPSRLWRTVPLAWALRQPVEPSVRQGTRDIVDVGARKLAFALSSLGSR